MILKTIFGLNRMVIKLFVLGILLIGGGAILAGSMVTTRAGGNDEADVREALLQSAVGFERADLNILNRIWANDESLTVFESGHANYGWADYRDHHLVPEMREMKNTKYALSDIRIKVTGATAWATFKYLISADIKDRRVEGGGLGTAVLEKREGRWQIVHWHSSAPRRAPATASPTSSPGKN